MLALVADGSVGGTRRLGVHSAWLRAAALYPVAALGHCLHHLHISATTLQWRTSKPAQQLRRQRYHKTLMLMCVPCCACLLCRCVDLVDVEDPRMDVCLYCLPPHRLRQNDVR